MQNSWTETAANGLMDLLSKIPSSIYTALTPMAAWILDYKKGCIARESIRLAIPSLNETDINRIAKQAARNTLRYLFSLPKLKKLNYQLHGLETVEQAMSEEKGAVVISLHNGPPDLGTLALAENGIPANTLIGAGKQTPFINRLGRRALDRVGVPFLQKGDPTAVFQALKKKNLIFLYSDLRSREMPVQFFSHETSAPASGLMTAQLLRAPILFHFCTREHTTQGEQWHLHFEQVETINTGNRKQDVQYNLQKLVHRMEQIIRQHPELWVWHYDRFKLKKRSQNGELAIPPNINSRSH
jgi:KDO2-lipid IV(A) lauroyltransferase